MKLRQLTVHTGPSIYAKRPALRACLDGEGANVLAIETLYERLNKMTAGVEPSPLRLAEFRTLLGKTDSVQWPEAYGALSVALQADRFEAPLAYRVATAKSDQERMILIETNDPPLGELAARLAVQLTKIIYDQNWDQIQARASEQITKGLRNFVSARSRTRLNENTRVLVEAARKRDIPVLRLVPNANVMVMGQGCKARRLSQLMSDMTSGVAVRVVAQDKSVTCQVLRDAGEPVPRHFVVRTKTQLTDAVKQIGFPLVVKGSTVNHGMSVTTGVMSEGALQTAIEKVQQFDTGIIVEQQIEGEDYRLSVVDGRLVAAVRRTPAQVTGDGGRTIRELMERENHRRRNLGRFAHWLVPLRLDDDALTMLARQGYSPDSVPQTDAVVILRSVANLSQGGLSEDVTDLVHPDVVRVAERAARLVGLDMAGVDIMTTDITRPLSETKGAILEVNHWPGMRVHYVTPTAPRDVAGAVLEYLFPDEDRGRIPTIAVTGTNGKTTTCRMLRRIFETNGQIVGMCTTDEVIIGGRKFVENDCAGGPYPAMIVKDPIVEAGVFEMARGALVRDGSRLDSYSVGVVTNVTVDHLGHDGIETLDDMARVKRLVAELAHQGVVLNADDKRCVAMASHVSVPVWWFTQDPGNTVVRNHLNRGGNAVIVTERDGREMLLKCGQGTEFEIVHTADIPATWHGLIRVNVANAAAAAAAALAAGIAIDTVRTALKSFSTNFGDSPGRFNIHEANGVTVILDNAHNIDGLRQMSGLMHRMPHDGKTLCFYATDITRDRSHCEQVAAALAHQFDHYVVSDQTPLARRRHETEIMDWLKQGLLKAGISPQSIEGTPDEWDGVSKILAMARPGDIVFVKTGEEKSAYWDFITGFDLSQA